MSANQLMAPCPPQPEQPLFVFLPGMDGTGQLLRRQLEGLQPHFDIRCLAIASDDLSDWPTLTQQVVQQITPLVTGYRPLYLCGESFGGCLALKVALAAPQLCQRLILVNPATSFSRIPWMNWAGIAAQWLPNPLYKLSTVALVPLLTEPTRVAPGDRAALLEAMQWVSPQTAAWRLQMLQQIDSLSLALEQVAQPTLVLTGAKDKLLPSVSEGRQLVRRLPQAQLTVLPHSGHAALLEAEVNLAAILSQNQFLPQKLTVER